MNPSISNDLADLSKQFANKLSARLDSILVNYQQLDLAAWEPDDANTLHRSVHGLTGSAGTFGMPLVSDASRALEIKLATLLKTGDAPGRDAWQAIGEDLVHLAQLARIQKASPAPSLKPPQTPPRLGSSPLAYIVDDDPEQVLHFGQTLRAAGYRVRVFTEPEKFRAAMTAPDTERPAAVLMDLVFPEGEDVGTELITDLGLGRESGIPVVVISVRDDMAARLAALRAGASRYLTKPVEPAQLADLMNCITGRQPPQPYRVLLVDDDPELLELQSAVLREAGMAVMTLPEPLKTLDAVDDFDPDVVVLDVYMPDASGPELAAVLRERDAQLPILFLSSETDMTQQLLALDLGGDDFLVKPVQPEHFVAAISARARRVRLNSVTKQHLQAILYEREREHMALDQHAIVSIADRSGSIVYVNNKFCEVSGYSRAELLGQNHRVVKSGQHPPEFYKEMWRTIVAGAVWQGEICNRRKDGSWYWVESTITPFLDDDGKPYQYVSVRTDITRVKAAEEAIRDSRQRMALHVQRTPLAVIEWDRNFCVTEWNPAAERIFGYARQEALGRHAKQLILPEEVSVHVDHLWQELLSAQGGLLSTNKNITKDGEILLCEWHNTPLIDETGEILGVASLVEDVTKQKNAETALIKAKEEAEHANQAKSEFLASMSHELRTPMNAVLGFSQLLEFDHSLSDVHKSHVREVLKAGNHLLELINQVLDLAKVEANHFEVSLEPIEVCPIVEDCVAMVSNVALNRDIQLSHCGCNATVVRADRTRLRQVLLNLLSNAIKYNHSGGSVKLEAQSVAAGRLRISVTDTGRGIPAERLGEVFLPFNRIGAENSNIEGTGIGLTLTQHIVEMMEGTIGVESELGVGSCFWIELPLASPSE